MRGRATVLLRGHARDLVGPGCAAVAVALVAAGLPAPGAGFLDVAALAAVAALAVESVAARARLPAEATFADVQVGLALVAAAYALVRLGGEPLSPLVYLVVAFAATFQPRAAAIAVVAACLALEAAFALRAHSPFPAAWHAAFVGAAALVHALFLRGLVATQRREHRERLEGEVRAMREEAREFRLIASALGAESRAPRTRGDEERKLAEGAVESIHQSMFYTLEMLKAALELKTCVLLWLDDTGERLKIKELVTDSDAVVETALPADAGAVGAIVRDRLLLNLPQPKRGHVPYYQGGEPVGAFLGVPVSEDGHLRGVLCADRAGPFAERDEKLLVGAAQQILRAIQSERVFVAVERGKYEHERFYHASAQLGRALTLEQVMDTAIAAAREICDFEMASIALFDREKRRHRVCRVQVAPGAEDIVDAKSLDGLEFGEGGGLTAMVVKNKHYLPAGGELRDPAMPVFTRRVKLKGVESLLVLPLICADEAIGTFTLATRRRNAFSKDARDMLGVIANQVAVSLENAKMYRQMETMATTDGLTGLLNHRTFQMRLADMLSRAERHGHKLALILIDIDFFKRINDTYGHPVGDQVLARVAKVLGDAVRKIDVVARYGGEEFAVIMEGADAVGAQQLAERIRIDVGNQAFPSEEGAFHVALSLGIAGVPSDAQDKQSLIERADQALYFAKHNGRNRTVTYQQFLIERAERRVG